jgi:hypothetical protein
MCPKSFRDSEDEKEKQTDHASGFELSNDYLFLIDPPSIRVEASAPYSHTIHFAGKHTNNRGFSCEIWGKIGNSDGYTYLATVKDSPYTVCYSDSAVNIMATYRLRWVSIKGEQSPWSELVSAIIK